MIIVPDSVVEFYHGVPLDNTYEHTVLFSDVSAQNNYFHGNINILSKRVNRNTYFRVERGVMRVEATAKELYNCNYLAFQNSSFAEKWFYAFVTNVEYVNNSTVDVSFELDVMQTYMFDYIPKESFVLREHVVNDTVGANLLSEPVEIGELTASSIVQSPYFGRWDLLIGHAFYENKESKPGGIFHNMLTGLDYGVIPVSTTTIDELKTFLKTVNDADKQSSVVSMTIVPDAFIGDASDVVTKEDVIGKPTSLHGYVPRNKKLLTYPYNSLVVHAGAESKVYKFEQFNTNECDFTLAGCYNGNPEISITPKSYQTNPNAGSGISHHGYNVNHQVVLSNFPMVGWAYDTFRSWLAQKGPSMALSSLIGATTAIAGVGASMMMGNPLPAMMGALAGAGSISKNVMEYSTAEATQGTEVRGSSSGGVNTATGDYAVYYETLQMRPQYARIADDYLDKYGYNCKELKVPNRNSRPHWNYVKTAGFNCVGNVPQKYLKKICNIYDSGITFWKSPSEVGNYSLNNH